MPHRLRPLAAATALVLCAAAARAHDTWFAPVPTPSAKEVALALGTGNQFPAHESAIARQYLVRSGCRSDATGNAVRLQHWRDAPVALLLQAKAAPGDPLSCWAQTQPFEVELAPDKIALYFKDIQASATVREAWARMNERGLPWKERYTKHARIELNPAARSLAPVDMAMDVLLETAQRPIRRGDALQFQLLRDGQPLPNFAVELRGDRVNFGLWRKTDAEGRVRFVAPLAGRWVLRGTDLRVANDDPDRWESRFVTLAFEIAEGVQKGSSLNANILSANQTAATPAMASEPPAITVRR